MQSLIRFILGGDSKPLEEAGKKGKSVLSDLRAEYRNSINTGAKWTAGLVAAGAAIGIHLINQAREAIDVQRALALQFNQTVATMATLERASDLTGVAFDKITASSKILEQNLGKAAQGSEKEAEAFKRLQLNAQALADLPLDERILKINAAIRENIPAVERAAVAAELFGAKNAQAMALLTPEDIQAAREETELFGHALSEIDATAVDNANDSFSRIKMAQEGLFKQLAVELSPMIQQIGQDFTDAAKEAGGMESVAKRITDELVQDIGFVMDAVEGLRRLFLLTGNAVATFALSAKTGMLTVAESIVAGPINALNKLIDLTNTSDIHDPGISQPQWIQDLQKNLDLSKRALQEALQAPDRILMEQLPSDALEEWVKKARAASAEAAKAVVDARASIASQDDTVSFMAFSDDEMKELQKSIEDMKKSAMDAMDATRTHTEEASAELTNFQNIVDTLGRETLTAMGVNVDSVFLRLRENIRAAAEEDLPDLQSAIEELKGQAQSTFDSTRTDIERAAQAMVDWQEIVNTMGNESLVNMGINSNEVMGRLIEDLEKAKDAAEDAFGELEEVSKKALRGIQDHVTSLLSGMESSFSETIRKISAEWASSQIMKAGLNWMAGSSNAGIAKMGADLLGSFAGGGDTGNGPRTGGLDGKGGFLAMMHPKETVIDRTSGQKVAKGGGDINIGGMSISLPNLRDKADAPAVGTALAQAVGAQLAYYQRMR